MTKFTVKTVFPVDENVEDKTYVSNKRTELANDVETADVIDMYKHYTNSGYDVNTKFKVPDVDENGSDIESDPFEMAKELTTQGIDYKASLKLDVKGAYDDVLQAIHMIESSGFDLVVDVKLKINDETGINIDDNGTWIDQDAVFKVTPKANSIDINDLKGLYDSLSNDGYDVSIDLKPKADKEDDPSDSFAKQLSVYPDGTEIDFALKQAEE